jgi:hypothetical protein
MIDLFQARKYRDIKLKASQRFPAAVCVQWHFLAKLSAKQARKLGVEWESSQSPSLRKH